MEEDLELRALKLRKLMKLTALRSRAGKPKGELDFDQALEIVRGRLGDRGDEVLQAALDQYPDRARKVVIVLARMIQAGRITRKIGGEALLAIFEQLGMPVKLRTRILYYKKGEYKSVADLIKRGEV